MRGGKKRGEKSADVSSRERGRNQDIGDFSQGNYEGGDKGPGPGHETRGKEVFIRRTPISRGKEKQNQETGRRRVTEAVLFLRGVRESEKNFLCSTTKGQGQTK